MFLCLLGVSYIVPLCPPYYENLILAILKKNNVDVSRKSSYDPGIKGTNLDNKTVDQEFWLP